MWHRSKTSIGLFIKGGGDKWKVRFTPAILPITNEKKVLRDSGGKITLNIMNHLLKNRRYMGEYSYRDVVKEDGIPTIVPKELLKRYRSIWRKWKYSRPTQNRERLFDDNKASLRKMRLFHGRGKRHKPHDKSIPLLSLRKYQEKETLRQESGRESLDWKFICQLVKIMNFYVPAFSPNILLSVITATAAKITSVANCA